MRVMVVVVVVAGCDAVFGLHQGTPVDAGSGAGSGGVVAHYTMDTVSAGSSCMPDDSGRGHDGTCFRGSPALIEGQVGSAYSFVGTSQVRIEPTGDLAGSGAFTFAGWFAVHSATGACPFNRILGVDANSWQLCLGTNSGSDMSTYLGGDGSAVGEIAVASNLTVDTWYHYALAYDGSTATMYLDGFLVGSSAFAISFDDQPITLGANTHDGTLANALTGGLDDVWIFDRALSVGEISDLAATSSN